MATGVGSRIGIALLGISALAILTAAQRPKSTPSGPAVSRTASEIRIWREANETRVMDELRALLEIPNFASDTDNIRRNAEKLKDMLETRGFETRLRDIDQRGPVVFGELKTPGAKRTIIFYMHYDGQSVDPKTWTGTKPYEPALRDKPLESEGQIISFPYGQDRYQDDWRLYARSAADDKSPIVALLAAMDALRARQIPRSAVESRKLCSRAKKKPVRRILGTRNRISNHSLLEGDLLINGDGPIAPVGKAMQVLFGNRGEFVDGANHEFMARCILLHSGHCVGIGRRIRR